MGVSAGRSSGRIFFSSQLSVLLFQYPLHLHVSAVSCKKNWGTAKCAYTLHMWLCIKWGDMTHDSMVYTECTEMVAVSSGTSHGATKQWRKYTTLVIMQKWVIKSYSHSCRIACNKSAVSLLESYIKAVNNKTHKKKTLPLVNPNISRWSVGLPTTAFRGPWGPLKETVEEQRLSRSCLPLLQLCHIEQKKNNLVYKTLSIIFWWHQTNLPWKWH